MSETLIVRAIQLEASRFGCRLFRNNVGLLETKSGSKMRVGLCVGSSDLIGIAPDGRFLAVEVKTQVGRTTPEQESFIGMICNMGGIAFVARSTEDFRREIRNALMR